MSHSERTVPALIECEAAARALYDYLDGRLPEASTRAVAAHVQTCKDCASHFEFARRVLTFMPAALPLAGDAALLRARIVSALATDGYSGR
jgi:anti-sigma factor RsiW